MPTALVVLVWIERALAGLALLSETGWIKDGKASEIIGRIPSLGLPIAEELRELKADIEDLLSRERITSEDLDALNRRASLAEEALEGLLQSKVSAPGPSSD